MINKDFKLQVGMKVKIRDDLIDGQKYGEDYFTNLMESYKGNELTIKRFDYRGSFHVDSNGWWFTVEMIDCIISTEPDKRYSLNSLIEKCEMFCITNIPYGIALTFGSQSYHNLTVNGNCFHPYNNGSSNYYYIEYSQLIIEKKENKSNISIDDLKVGTVVTLKKDFNYARIYADRPSENKEYKIYNLHHGLHLSQFKDLRSAYPIECIESIVGKENDTSKKKWKLDEIPTNTYIHNFPSVEKLNGLIDFFNKKTQTTKHRYKKFPSEDPTLYISNTGYIDVFHQCPKHTDKTIIDYSNIIIEDKKEKSKIKFEGDGIGWYKQNKPYCDYNFYDHGDIDFSEKKITAESKKSYKSKIDTKAPKIVGEYSSAYRKYKPKKGE